MICWKTCHSICIWKQISNMEGYITNPAILYWYKNRNFQKNVISSYQQCSIPWPCNSSCYFILINLDAVIAPEHQMVWIFYPAGTYSHRKGQCWRNVLLLFLSTNASNSPDGSYASILFLKWPARCSCSAHIQKMPDS